VLLFFFTYFLSLFAVIFLLSLLLFFHHLSRPFFLPSTIVFVRIILIYLMEIGYRIRQSHLMSEHPQSLLMFAYGVTYVQEELLAQLHSVHISKLCFLIQKLNEQFVKFSITQKF
jgi:FlaA1/EpsC-like NDP-sugar epimerase